MMRNLFSANTPAVFWRCLMDVAEDQWRLAIADAKQALQLPGKDGDLEDMLQEVLGEGRLRASQWKLSSAKRFYYAVKPFLPQRMTLGIRRIHRIRAQRGSALSWPIEDRYAQFQWQVMRGLIENTGQTTIPFIHFWPDAHRFGFVLTHDIETSQGQDNVRRVADLEASLGFRSSFNFVPELYPIDDDLVAELIERGFEIGVHGLKHDGKLFSSRGGFARKAELINAYLERFGSVGFRAPLTHRQPQWMQLLELEYDSSFFDTDPFEPLPGGTMSIWPFEVGRFIELPYTLAQDFTLTMVLGENTPRIWQQKVDFIERFYGMVLVNTHPDYLLDKVTWDVYSVFLQSIRDRGGYWHALPRDIARWWRARSYSRDYESLPRATKGNARIAEGQLVLDILESQ